MKRGVPAVTALGFWLLLSAMPATGQRVQVFDVEDFVDPSLLELLGKGQEAKAFAALSLVGGTGRNLQRWGEFAEEDFHFAHLAGDLYYRNWQIGMDAFSLDSQAASPRFGDRLGIEVGRYSTSETYVVQDTERQRQELVRFVRRALLAWQVERRPHGGLGHSVTLGLDIRRDGPRVGIADPIGGYTYTWVQAGEGDHGHDRHQLSLDFRSPIAAYRNGAQITTGFGIGAERSLGHYRWGAVRLELAGDLPIRALRSKVRLSWAPSYQLDRGEFNNEVALLVVPPLFSQILSPSRIHFGSQGGK